LSVNVVSICCRCYVAEKAIIVCGSGKVVLGKKTVLICNSCAVSIPFLIENEKPSYKEPPKEVCFYAYKKINHFLDTKFEITAKF
jgi:hypothetical protein